MRYSGGKTRIANQIAQAISERERESTLVSLFCGGLSVETKLAPYFSRIICNDKQQYLMALYQAIQGGWEPPDNLSVEEYYYVKEHPDENKALTGFVGFGCSFGGKWFAGYGRHGTKTAQDAVRNMCKESKRALLRDMKILNGAEFICRDYCDIILPENCVVYADPPYKGKMAAFGLKEQFDSGEFWQWCRDNSKNHHIYISELEAPADFEEIWRRPVLRQLANCNADNFVSVEKLFVHKPDK